MKHIDNYKSIQQRIIARMEQVKITLMSTNNQDIDIEEYKVLGRLQKIYRQRDDQQAKGRIEEAKAKAEAENRFKALFTDDIGKEE